MKEVVAQLIRFCGRRRGRVFLCLVLLGVVAAGTVIGMGRFTNDVSRLFPETRETRATFDLIHKSHLSDTVQLEFISGSDITEHAGYLDRTAEKLAKSPLVKRVTFRYRSDDLDAELANFSKLAPRFFTPEILDKCDPDAAAKNALKQLAFPAPGLKKRLRSQPFDWDKAILNDLKKLDDATGMELDRSCPFFVTRDRRRAMIVVETGVRLGDADAVRKLFAELDNCAAPMPEGVEMRIISGCSHTLGNEEVLKRDAMIAGAVSLVLFVLLFLYFYRGDWRALWIPLLPLYASLIALFVMAALGVWARIGTFGEICLYVIGLGGCITGLAVDQGIHVYSAFRGADAEKRTVALVEPMLLSALTSVAVFVFLAFTGIPAYIQLAVFAGLSLVFSAVLALVILPQLLDKDRVIRRVFPAPEAPRQCKWAYILVILPVAAALAVLPQVIKRADFALDSLDGTPEKILNEEREFRAAWHKPKAETAALAAGGETGEAALEHLESVVGELQKIGISVAMPPRPSLKRQKANRESWGTPEVAKKIDALEARCREACRRQKLERLFEPFFAGLRRDIASDDLTLPPIMTHIESRMIKSHGEIAAAVALLPDTPKNAAAIRGMLEKNGDAGAALLSKTGFKQMIVEELGGRFKWLLPLSLLAALAMLFAVFRKPGDVLLAMVPVAVAFSGVTLIMYATNFRATPAAAFALVLLTGLSVDYGIYAVSQLRHPDDLDTRNPILLSAATTVAGAGALLTSRHPALYGTGVVLAPGIALACLSGIYLVPMLKNAKLSKAALILVMAAALWCVNGCATRPTPWKDYPEAETTLRRMRPYPDRPFKIQALTTAEFPGREMRFVLAAELDERNGKVRTAGVDPGSGALLFKYDGDPAKAPLLGTAIADDAPPELSEFLTALSEDLRRIFFLKSDIPLAVTEKTEYITVSSSDGTDWMLTRDGMERRRGAFPFRKWRAVYRDSGRCIEYRRFDGMDYTLNIKVNKKDW